jgi:hypothetical protein
MATMQDKMKLILQHIDNAGEDGGGMPVEKLEIGDRPTGFPILMLAQLENGKPRL